MNKERELKICFTASSGGHFEQLLMLKPIMDKYSSFILTERTNYEANVQGIKMYYLKQINRKEFFLIVHLITNFFRTFKIFIEEKPDVVISTGVLSTIPMCLISKLFGKKLIYIESFAKVTSATKTGKLMYKLADQFYVQWETLLEIYPNAIYLGGIY